MNKTKSDIIVTDTIDADQIEIGDQIIVNAEPIEVDTISDTPDDSDGIRVSGFSWEDGDRVTHDLHYSERVDLWAV